MDLQENAEICYLDEIVIQGITTKGKKFRPSDWVDRLCGMLAVFDHNQRMAYSPFLRPMQINGMGCVAVRKSLADGDMCKVYEFIMQFASDNDLVVIDCSELKNKLK